MAANTTPVQPPRARPAGPPPAPLDATGPDGVAADEVARAQKAWADHLRLPVEQQVILGKAGTLTFHLVPPGAFVMGSPADEEGRRDDEAERPVTLTAPYYLAKTPVTRGQFRAFVTDSGHTPASEASGEGGFGWDVDKGTFARGKEFGWRNPGFGQKDDHPVVNVTWDDAAAFCAWLAKKTKLGARLPTEAEWEYGCRAGTRTRFFGGDDAEELVAYANVADAAAKALYPDWRAVAAEDGYVFTSPVGAFGPNALGLHDTHGNVWEWCADWYDPHPAGPASDPAGPAAGPGRVARGGSWFSWPLACRSAHRGCVVPGGGFIDLGFRPALGVAR